MCSLKLFSYIYISIYLSIYLSIYIYIYIDIYENNLTVVVKVAVLGVCVSPGYSCVVLCTVVMYLVSRFFSQLLLSRS